ncbi:MAG: serine--tRNA ligase [Candidatus Omnitrophica bacterium]|nr:serine--tRNA ligase [Candidatus Omnitrophota bacterium]MBU1048011.1 serine--tRNA ligase [Candidatus Omnitrophota bacterium]MBU1630435.1 serine--tRNA ligase [Candidatus Omnitrophota bacterium]MBU1767526.1 serine--tRNA ligase [Candidatus Omnitrophota bacterium]MBU1889381.1 serine--tRNA ligase [Candidatus Omnitrophota bacterium]
MLKLEYIRSNAEVVKKAMRDRGMKVNIDELLKSDEERRKLLSEVETLKHQRNTQSDDIGKLIKEGKDAEKLKDEMRDVSEQIKGLDKQVKEIEDKVNPVLLTIPNIPHSSVPVGKDAKDNKVIRQWGTIPKFNFSPKDHLQLAKDLDIIDFERALKIVGSNFPLYKGMGALLERALINFMLDVHTKEHKYTEISPPFLANRATMTGTGQLPKLEEDMYHIEKEDYFLIPTAEVPLTNLHAGETFPEEDLPIYYTGYTPCFRREAGSYGKDTKGLIRVHQFDKVEMVKFVKPENSFDELESMLKNAEDILQKLKLPYRIILLCTGDMGFSASKCYDIELWASGLERYLEVSSCSNCTNFQAQRISAKYKPKGGGKPIYLHTLNGSGVALARTVIAILENYQQEDGSILIPEVLRPYMNGKTKIEKT